MFPLLASILYCVPRLVPVFNSIAIGNLRSLRKPRALLRRDTLIENHAMADGANSDHAKSLPESPTPGASLGKTKIVLW